MVFFVRVSIWFDEMGFEVERLVFDGIFLMFGIGGGGMGFV